MAIIRAIPGDLVELDNGWEYLITGIDKAYIYFYTNYDSNPLFRKSDLGLMVTDVSASFMEIERFGSIIKHGKIRRLFEFNLYNSAVCCENICFPRKINEECTGCPLGSVIGQVTTLFLPCDEVFIISKKEVTELEAIHIAIKDATKSGGYLSLRGFNKSNYSFEDRSYMFSTFFSRFPKLTRLREVWELLKNDNQFDYKLRYYTSENSIGKFGDEIKLRERGMYSYLKAEDINTICHICIYQDTEKCYSECNIKKIYG